MREAGLQLGRVHIGLGASKSKKAAAVNQLRCCVKISARYMRG